MRDKALKKNCNNYIYHNMMNINWKKLLSKQKNRFVFRKSKNDKY